MASATCSIAPHVSRAVMLWAASAALLFSTPTASRRKARPTSSAEPPAFTTARCIAWMLTVETPETLETFSTCRAVSE
jgi:hypothetical protein